MSGGYFGHEQYFIQCIAEKLQMVVDNSKNHYVHTEEDGNPFCFSEETIKEFNSAIDILNAAYIYVQRIDWLLSSDDSEEAFHRRLQEDCTTKLGTTRIEIYSDN